MRIDAEAEVEDDVIGESAERAADLRPWLAEAETKLRALIDASFDRDASPDGSPWAPRLTTTRYTDGRPARPLTERRPGRPLLQDTGSNRNSISVSVEGDSVIARAVSDHASYLQFGTRHMPARAFLPVTRTGPMTTGPAGELYRQLAESLAKYIVEGET